MAHDAIIGGFICHYFRSDNYVLKVEITILDQAS